MIPEILAVHNSGVPDIPTARLTRKGNRMGTFKVEESTEAFDLVVGELETEMSAAIEEVGPWPSCVPGGYCLP